jgi:hypothetical protein
MMYADAGLHMGGLSPAERAEVIRQLREGTCRRPCGTTARRCVRSWAGKNPTVPAAYCRHSRRGWYQADRKPGGARENTARCLFTCHGTAWSPERGDSDDLPTGAPPPPLAGGVTGH